MPNDVPPILVAACGNIMAGDDGFGPRVARELRRRPLPRAIEVLDLGMKPAGLIAHLEHRAGLVLVDAAITDDDEPEAALIELDFFDPNRPSLWHDASLSSHGLSLAHELELAQRLDLAPERVRLIAAPVTDVRVGAPLGAVTRSLLRPAADRIEALVRHWLRETKAPAHA